MRRSLLLLAGFLGVLPPAAAGQPLTEEQALERMRAGHPYLEALRLGVREVEAEARERSLIPNPTVGYTREDSGLGVDEFLLLSLELPLRGRAGLLHDAATQAAATAEARADASRLDFEARLRLAFTELLLAQERVAVLEAGVAELGRLVDVLGIGPHGRVLHAGLAEPVQLLGEAAQLPGHEETRAAGVQGD